MNTHQVSNSAREKYRTDFSTEFLNDLVSQGTVMDIDPYNHIGVNFGHNNPRAYQIWHDRQMDTHVMTRRQAS